MKKFDKKTLYESIMRDVSKVIKKHLNENNQINLNNYDYDYDLTPEDNAIMFLFQNADLTAADAWNGGIDVDGEWIEVDGISIEDGYPVACIWDGECWDSTETNTMWELALNCLEEIYDREYCENVLMKMQSMV